jgi:hypothetical protein
VLMILCGLVNRMTIALWILAIGPNITVLHRILHTWMQTKPERSEVHAATAAAQKRAGGIKNASPVPNILTRSAGRGR